MIRIAALTSGRLVPSTRFRVRQHIQPLRQFDIQVDEYTPAISKYADIPGWPEGFRPAYKLPLSIIWQGAKLLIRLPGVLNSWRYSITWLERPLLEGYFTLESLLKKPLVFDVDDAIWLTPPFGGQATSTVARRADVVIAGNRYLADWLSKYAQNVHIIPTAVDTERFKPLEKDYDNSRFVIGWTGVAANLRYLEAIEAPLKHFLDRFVDAELLVVSDRRPHFQHLSPNQVRYLPWSSDMEADGVRQMDTGLMPLPDNQWTRGKCSFKMLQYMSCGVPVVASPLGMNVEVFTLGEIGLSATTESDWYEAFEYFYLNRADAWAYGANGRAVI